MSGRSEKAIAQLPKNLAASVRATARQAAAMKKKQQGNGGDQK